MDIYLVGGAVRDRLLGRPVTDRDWVVVGATPEQMLAKGYKQVGADFPVFLHPKTGEEYALARTERKQGHGYHGFTVYSAPDVTLEQDLQRRDLTINAMAQAEDGTIIDPFHGQQDLNDRRLRHVSDAFREDPLRVLRTARFLARFHPLGFTIAEDTLALMKAMTEAGEIRHLVPERVWQEIQRALHESTPTAFFRALKDCGALADLLPELSSNEPFEAAMQTLDCMARSPGPETDQLTAALLSPLSPGEILPRAKALKAPNHCQDLSRLTVLCRPAFQDVQQLTGDTLMAQLDLADAWRRPDRLCRLLSVFRCLPGGLPDDRHAQICLAVDNARQVQARDFIPQGLKGKALGEAMREERLRRLDEIMTRPTPADGIG